MTTQIKDILQDIGLSDKESLVFFTLLQGSSMYVALIAKNAHINRTTTYGVLKTLIERGLVSSSVKRGVTQYQSIDPTLLPEYIARQRENLAKSEQEIKKILPQLKLIREKHPFLPKIQFFEGKEGIKQVYEDTLENNKGKVLYDLTGTDAVFKLLDTQWVERYLTKRAKLGIKCLDIAPDSKQARLSKKQDAKYLRKTKLIPEEFLFDTEIDIYDNKVLMVSLSQKHPVAVMIEDENIAHTMKTIFKYIDSTIKK